ncbi:uncharacterized protein F4807DRAFT_462027 [Annulohypoxylon truncatum]|uniref:uncharacterized protein n=1 Tax=Annulohypoxylon truncatum TaxID=327061 RepID=UPI00200828F8|nr:uncharacterized protein F4807DRAFT_462027 [Annulohypoxylon truncatum]KAI1207932.1 hypothetical protein F4807DRAFT_462027 [Annulohypoxylon truncatum]
MKFTSGPIFATLALTAYLPSILAAEGFAPSQRSVAVFSRGELANNATAAANGTDVADAGQAEENKDGENADENANNDQNAEDQQNAEEQNQDDNQNDQNLQQELGDLENLNGINIDPNNLEGSLQQNIGNLMLGLGICDFNIGSIGGIGVGNQIQLLLQLQQLQQLQQLGLVNSFSIQQLLQQELLLGQFNLNIFKRTISATIKQAARANKRTVMTKRECKGQNNAKGN